MKAVAFTGMPGAGKSEAVAVAQELDVPVVRMGDQVWDEVRARNLPLTPDEVGRVASEMRESHGAGVWAERTAEAILKLDTDRVVIDGLRTLAEAAAFRERLGEDFTLVAVHASPATRRARILGRGREDDARDDADFEARDARELSWGIGAAIAMADVIVVNEGDVDEVRARVRHLLS